MMRQPPSPYAAPNSPIASAKRARVVPVTQSRPLNSPIKDTRRSAPAEPISFDDEDDEVPIFSPGLHGVVTVPNPDHHYPPRHLDHEHPHIPYEDEGSGLVDSAYEDAPAEGEGLAGAEDEDDDGEEEEFNPFLFISSLPQYHTVSNSKKICLPPGRMPGKLTLALDLDETLVHCTVDPVPNPDHVFSVVFNDSSYQVYVRKRPYLDYFLEYVSTAYEVVVFTASQQVYADKLLDLIDPERRLVHHRLFRESCLQVQGNYLKDLHVLGRELHKTMLVDNSPHAYGYQVDNGIPIESWFEDDADTELLKLSGFLRKIQNSSDVRPVIREHFKTYKLVEKATAMKRKSL